MSKPIVTKSSHIKKEGDLEGSAAFPSFLQELQTLEIWNKIIVSFVVYKNVLFQEYVPLLVSSPFVQKPL